MEDSSLCCLGGLQDVRRESGVAFSNILAELDKLIGNLRHGPVNVRVCLAGRCAIAAGAATGLTLRRQRWRWCRRTRTQHVCLRARAAQVRSFADTVVDVGLWPRAAEVKQGALALVGGA